MADFYVSYHVTDEEYAKWLAGQAEEAGYSTLLGAWDFRAGSNLIVEIQGALRKAKRVLALLSPEYLLGALSQAELAAAIGQDPTGERGRLLPVMVRPCTPTGLLAQLQTVHLENLDEQSARQRLLDTLAAGAGLAAGAPARRAPFPVRRTRVERPAFPRDRQWQLQRLPLPLAQLYQRTLNSKSAADRHLNAYYLAEATLKLAAALRLGLWLERALEPGGALARRFEALFLPDPEHWLALLSEVDAALAQRQDAALLPLGAHLGQLDAPQSDWGGVAALAQLLRGEGALETQEEDAARPPSLRTFFRVVLAYRSGVLHRAPRGDDFANRMAEMWLAALAEVFDAPGLFGELRLVQAQMRSGGSGFFWGFQDLTGPVNLPLEGPALPQREDLQPGALYFGGAGALVPLAPFCAYHEDDLGRGAVGILHAVRQRTRREGRAAQGGDAGVVEILGADYLDYATGLPLRGLDAAEALVSLLQRLRNQPATPEEVKQIQERSAVVAQAAPEEIVSADAALGDFALLGELGRGAMGIVYKARQRNLGRMVALKVLPPTLAADATLAARFRREIAALGRCAHPQVVGILGSGVDHDRAYYAMELIEGADLGRVSKRLVAWQPKAGALTEGHLVAAAEAAYTQAESPPVPAVGPGRTLALRLCELFADAALGLAHLHQQGVIHRDLKPGNLMLTRDGQRLVIADLGLARLLDASQALSQSHGPQVGTLRYMAPELLEGHPADARSDIYALGASLYELLAGHPMFEGETETHLRQLILQEQPSVRRLGRGMPAGLAAVIEVATAREPSDRYDSAQALAADLLAVAEQRPIKARPPGSLQRLRLYARRQPAVVALTSVLVLLPILATLSYVQWARESATWYANLIERRGVWEGVGPVSSLRQRHRNATFRFVSQKGRLVRVERRNGRGFLRDDAEGEASWQFIYEGDSARVLKIISRDQRDIVQRQRLYSDDLTRLEYRDPQGRPKPKKGTDISLEIREFDAGGLVLRERFANLHEAPRINSEGYNGEEREKTQLGQNRRIQVLQADGSAGTTNNGIASASNEYDSDGNEVSRSIFGADGRPILDSDGISSCRRRFDAHGNEVENAFFGTDGKPALHEDGYAITRFKYDERGDQLEVTFLGTDGKLALSKGGYAIWRRKFDERGNLVESHFFGVEGTPVRVKEGFASARNQYDKSNNLVESAYFDEAGKPTLLSEGFALSRSKFDERGNQTEISYFGTDGQPTLNKEGLATWCRTYDKRGNEVASAYFGADGKPILGKEGVAGWHGQYDERGNQTEMAYFGIDGKPTLHKDGMAKWRRQYDERGNAVDVFYYGTDGKPTFHSEGCARSHRGFDEHGNQIETAYFGIDGKPTLSKDGVASWHHEFDARGNQVAISYFGSDGKPTLHKDGVASWRSKYDERGNRIELTYFGIDGKPTLHKSGFFKWRGEYDERGNQVASAYFGTDDKPTLHKDGVASIRRKFDERGSTLEDAYFGIDGNPTLDNNGVASVRQKYDERGWRVLVSYFGTDDKPTLDKNGVASWSSQYDERGNQVEIAYFGLDGKPVLSKEGFSIRRRQYDGLGNVVAGDLFGTDGKPILFTDGYASWKDTYDERSKLVRSAYFGIDGKPTRHKDGYSSFRSRYDERGNRVQISFFDTDGKPAPQKDGCASLRYQYNEHNHQVRGECLGADGKLALNKEGYASVRRKYNERGNPVLSEAFDIDGKPTLNKDGYASLQREYDERGNQVKLVYLDIAGKPTLHPKGYASLSRKYDERGNELELAYFGIDAKPVLHKDGFSIVRYQYDGRGHQVERAYFDIKEKPVSAAEGCASVGQAFDARGGRTEFICRDAGGKAKLCAQRLSGQRAQREGAGRPEGQGLLGCDGQPLPRGVLVTRLLSEGQALSMRLQTGDLITAYEGQAVLNLSALNKHIAQSARATALVTVLRAGRVVTLQAQKGPLGFEGDDTRAP